MWARIGGGVAMALISVVILIGCGSDAQTTPAQARAVAASEDRFLNDWGEAYRRARARCDGLTEEAGARCMWRVEGPLQGHAVRRFEGSIEAILEEGVGPKCSEELEETVDFVFDVPYFPGDARTTCLKESRRTS